MAKGKKLQVIRAVRSHARSLLSQDAPVPIWLGKLQDRIVFLYWLCDHYRKFSPASAYLSEAKADLASIVYVLNLQLERSVYLHSRSLLENLVRHCFYDSHLSAFVAEHCNEGECARRRWSDLLQRLESLVYFRTVRTQHSESSSLQNEATSFQADTQVPVTDDAVTEGIELFPLLRSVYSHASNFIHSPTFEEKSDHISIRSMKLTDERSRILSKFIHDLYDACAIFLSIYNLGAYLTIAQPIRGYLLSFLSMKRRTRLMCSFNNLSIDYAVNQKKVALRLLLSSKSKNLGKREGIILAPDGSSYICI